jgi:hypothetical protein
MRLRTPPLLVPAAPAPAPDLPAPPPCAAPADEREAEGLRIVRLLRDLAPDAQPDA